MHLQGQNKVKIKIKGRISNKASMDLGDKIDITEKEAFRAVEDKILNQIKFSKKKYQLKDSQTS